MCKERVQMDWHFIGDDLTWRQLTQTSAANISTLATSTGAKTDSFSHFLTGFVLILLATLMAASASPRPHQIQVKRDDFLQAMTLVVEAEEQAWRNRDEEAAARLLDAAAPSAWIEAWRHQYATERRLPIATAQMPQVTIEHIERPGDLALVEAQITDMSVSWLPVSYRETRVYRSTPMGWRRTVPTTQFWGGNQHQEIVTDHFVFQFHARDLQTVIEAAPILERLYAALRQKAKLPMPTSEDRLVVHIAIMAAPHFDLGQPVAALPTACTDFLLSQPGFQHDGVELCANGVSIDLTGADLTVPTPALLPIPVGISDGDALVQVIAYALAAYVLEEGIRSRPM